MNDALHRLALASFLSIAACGYVCPGPDTCPELEDDSAESIALERAARYLSRKALTGREAWFVGQGGHLLGGEFVPWMGQLVVERRGAAAVDRAMLRRANTLDPLPPTLPPPERPTPGEIAPPISAWDRDLGWDAMFLAATCPKLDKEGRKRLRGLILRTAHSYLLVAQLWALVTAHHLDCPAAFEFERWRRRLLDRLHAELLADPRIHGLTVERMAALCYAGACAWIPEDYIEGLLAAQHPVGGWLDPHFDGGAAARPTAMTMTATAFYVLALRSTSRERP